MNKEIIITIFTPTYNRAYTLQNCYESLKRQSYNNFEWLIYDDGSSDNTKELIEGFIKENVIKIRYYYGENAGKHVAINRATDLAEGELFFIVDSDDYLTNDALELVNDAWNSISLDNRKKFIGVSGKRYLVNKENKDFNFREKYYDTDAIRFNLIDKNIQDKAEVYVTKILKNYKFPEFEGENFMTEAVIWYKLAEDGYKIRWFNENIYICEYLEDGLTANFYKRRVHSIKGTCYSYNKLSSFNLPLKYRFRYKINYYRYGLCKYSLSKLFKESNNRKLSVGAIGISSILFIYDRIRRK